MLNKIIFAINDLSFGGGQMTVVEEANRLFKKGFEVYVLTLFQKNGKENFAKGLMIPAGNVVNIPFRSLWDLPAFLKLIRLLRFVRPDVVFSNLFFTNTLIRLAKVFYPRMKVIVREGNLPIEKSFKIKVIDSILSLLTFCIIVNAKAIKAGFKKLWIPQGKLEVVYNGIDESFFVSLGEGKNELRKKLGIPIDAFVLISIASLTKKKGHEYLIRAMAEVRRSQAIDRKVLLLIIGDGPEAEKLQLLIVNYQLQNEVKFLGARHDIKELLTIADLFILPSLWEGMPNAMLEAMAMELPVVVTAVGGITEIVDNKKNGLVVQPKNADVLALAIRELIADPMLREELGRAAKQSVISWTWDNHLQALIKLFTR